MYDVTKNKERPPQWGKGVRGVPTCEDSQGGEAQSTHRPTKTMMPENNLDTQGAQTNKGGGLYMPIMKELSHSTHAFPSGWRTRCHFWFPTQGEKEQGRGSKWQRQSDQERDKEKVFRTPVPSKCSCVSENALWSLFSGSSRGSRGGCDVRKGVFPGGLRARPVTKTKGSSSNETGHSTKSHTKQYGRTYQYLKYFWISLEISDISVLHLTSGTEYMKYPTALNSQSVMNETQSLISI